MTGPTSDAVTAAAPANKRLRTLIPTPQSRVIPDSALATLLGPRTTPGVPRRGFIQTRNLAAPSAARGPDGRLRHRRHQTGHLGEGLAAPSVVLVNDVDIDIGHFGEVRWDRPGELV
ncbi:MAG: hypothetical protein JO152_09060 [Mycobacteriaceae bacterium]|nr:hypothetical protein [Mycobacteriaceae bacterium]